MHTSSWEACTHPVGYAYATVDAPRVYYFRAREIILGNRKILWLTARAIPLCCAVDREDRTMIIEQLRAMTEETGWTPIELGRRIGYRGEHGPIRFVDGTGNLTVPNAEKVALVLGHELRLVKCVTPVAPTENPINVGEK